MKSEVPPSLRRPKVGDWVQAIQKKDYGSGQLTVGRVQRILTSKPYHPRGIKVELEGGIIGRVQGFPDERQLEPAPPTKVDTAYFADAEGLR